MLVGFVGGIKDNGIKYISFFYEKVPERNEIIIQLYLDDEYIQSEYDKRESENAFIADGFMIGMNKQALILDPVPDRFGDPHGGLMLITNKSDTLGSMHPDNKNGKEYFSNGCKPFSVCQLSTDGSWKAILQYTIDERHFNTFASSGGGEGVSKHPDIHKWVMAEFKKMKASDPEYGTYGDKNRDQKCEGKRCLYAFELMKWLQTHPMSSNLNISKPWAPMDGLNYNDIG